MFGFSTQQRASEDAVAKSTSSSDPVQDEELLIDFNDDYESPKVGPY